MEIKKERILASVVKIVAEKGYECTTTRNISQEAKVSHGTLHYYFKNKEEMISLALEANLKRIMEYAISMEKTDSIEQLGMNIIKYLKKSILENSTYYRFLFTIWSISWQNKKIKEILDIWHERVLIFLMEEINKYTLKVGFKITSKKSKSVALYLMFLIDGTILHLLDRKEYVNDTNMWSVFKNSIIATIVER